MNTSTAGQKIVIILQPTGPYLGTSTLALRIRNSLEFHGYNNVAVKDTEVIHENQEHQARFPASGESAHVFINVEDFVPGAYRRANLSPVIQARGNAINVSVIPNCRQIGATTVRQIIALTLISYKYNRYNIGGTQVTQGEAAELMHRSSHRNHLIQTPIEIRVLTSFNKDHDDVFKDSEN